MIMTQIIYGPQVQSTQLRYMDNKKSLAIVQTVYYCTIGHNSNTDVHDKEQWKWQCHSLVKIGK